MSRSIVTAVAALLLASSTAFAADLGPRPVPVAAPPVINWTGFYIGVHGGYGRSDFNEDVDGWFAGGQVGYNYQFANRFVFGVEADLAYADIGLTVSDTAFGITVSATTNIDLIGSLRARIGYGFDRALVYATGGAAFTRHELSASVTVPPVTVTLADDQIHWGWTVGGGIEFLVTNNLTFKGEYLYSDYGEQTYFAGTPAQLTGSLQNHTAKLGINWLFR